MSSANHDQIALAAEQLDIAIELFIEERSDVCALTLAGAAEEILGCAVKQLTSSENAMQQAYEIYAQTHRHLYRKELEWKHFAEEENYARNAAKHLLQDRSVEADFRRAAMWMIVRACANHDRLELERTDRMWEFDNWFYEHEVGVQA